MNILIAAAHPDDEVLGAGASIARWVREGHHVSVLFFTDGVGSRGKNTPAIKIRQKAARKAAEILGFSIAGFGKFPDNQLDRVSLLEITQSIERIKKKLQPEFVLTHFWGDLNIDHRRVFEAVLTAFRPQPGEKCRTIQSFEVASATEWGSPATAFRPTVYNEVSTQDVEKAVRAYQAYSHEVRADPHARSLEAFLARRALRGRETGVEWAEGFVLNRQLDALPPAQTSPQ
jgi:LmbE family N-acetylglucosaminyl deacetylase